MQTPNPGILAAIMSAGAKLFGKRDPNQPNALSASPMTLNPTGPTQPNPGLIMERPGRPINYNDPLMTGNDQIDRLIRPTKPQDSALGPGQNPLSSPPADDTAAQIQSQLAQNEQDYGKLSGQYQEDRARLMAPPPTPASRVPTTGESLGSIIAMLTGPQTPLGYTRATNAPQEIAQTRADQQDKFNLANYARTSQNAAQLMDATRAVMSQNVTREDALQRIKEQYQGKQIAAQSKVAVQTLKNDAGFTTTLAKMFGDGTASVQGISQLLQGQGQPPQLADATAQQLYNDAQLDPSYKMKLMTAAQGIKQQQFQSTLLENQFKDTMATVQNPNATRVDRIMAFQKLNNMRDEQGNPVLPQNMSFDEFVNGPPGAVTKGKELDNTLKLDRIANLPLDLKLKLQKVNMNSDNLAILDKRLAYFDPDMQSKLLERSTHIAEMQAQTGKIKASPKQQTAAINGLRTLYQYQLTRLDKQRSLHQMAPTLGKWTDQDEQKYQAVKGDLYGRPKLDKDGNPLLDSKGDPEIIPGIEQAYQAAMQQELQSSVPAGGSVKPIGTGPIGTGPAPAAGWKMPKGAYIRGGPHAHAG